MRASELEVGPFYIGPGSVAVDIFAPFAIKIDGEHLWPHGMFFRVCLEVAKLSAALIVPRSASSAVFKSENRLGEIVAAVVDRGHLHHHGLDDRKHLLEGLILEGGAEGSAVAVLYLKDDNVWPIEHKLPCSELLGVKFLLESNAVVS